MRRRVPGLRQTAQPVDIPDGIYLVTVRGTQHRWDRNRPFFELQFAVLEPKRFANFSLSARLYYTQKALWKLSWFLRDFGYDLELINNDELDESALLNLRGIIKISHTTVNGTSHLNIDGFGPAEQWPSFSDSATSRELAS